jgi:hypothetical protein
VAKHCRHGRWSDSRASLTPVRAAKLAYVYYNQRVPPHQRRTDGFLRWLNSLSVEDDPDQRSMLEGTSVRPRAPRTSAHPSTSVQPGTSKHPMRVDSDSDD